MAERLIYPGGFKECPGAAANRLWQRENFGSLMPSLPGAEKKSGRDARNARPLIHTHQKGTQS